MEQKEIRIENPREGLAFFEEHIAEQRALLAQLEEQFNEFKKAVMSQLEEA